MAIFLAGCMVMALADRLRLYEELERVRDRPLIVYVTSGRFGMQGRMDADVIPELCDQLEALNVLEQNPGGKIPGIDLLVVSDGGDAMVAWRAITLLRERTDNLAVLIPYGAYSAATLLALGADQILMHPNGNLGPVDPQISVRDPEGQSKQFGFEDMAGFIEFLREQLKITDQEHLRAMFEMFCKEVGTVPVGIAARSSLLTLSMGEKLLRLHMTKDTDIPKAQGIAKALTKGFFYHGYPVGRKEAIEINLPVAPPNVEVERLMWRIWQDIERELEFRKPFFHQHVLMESEEAHKLLKPVPQMNLPVSAPPEVLQKIIEDLAQQSIEQIEPVEYEVVTALLESRRRAVREVLRGKILAYRTPELDLQINAVRASHSWEQINA